jgi:PTH1 family peptidyl-tRNA hydrolase
MLLIAGLGNPEAKYAKNRHNIGFMAIDALARHFGFPAYREKFHALVSDGMIDTTKVLLVKPQTFMNRSGVSLAEAASFYKLSGDQIIVFYDELDLPPGKLRMRRAAGWPDIMVCARSRRIWGPIFAARVWASGTRAPKTA